MRLLSEFSRLDVRYLVVGMSAAILQGADMLTQDLDLWLDLSDPNLAIALRNVGVTYYWRSSPPFIAGSDLDLGNLDVVRDCSGLEGFSKEFSRSKTVSFEGIELNVLPLDRVIVSKTAANRPKDRAVLPALKAALAAQKQEEE